MSSETTEKFGLSRQDIEHYQSVFADFPQVERVILYGSRAKGNYRPASDIDLTLIGALDWQTFNELEQRLDDLMLPYQLDLSICSQIDNPELIEHIKRVGKVFYEKAS